MIVVQLVFPSAISLARSRRTNFCTLPVEVLGSSSKTMRAGSLNRARDCVAPGFQISFVAAAARFDLHKGAGAFAPFFVGHGNDAPPQPHRMLVEDILDLDGGDVFTAGNDDVLRAVLQLDIAIGIDNAEIAGSETSRLQRPPWLLADFSDSLSSQHCRASSLRQWFCRQREPLSSFRDRARSIPQGQDSARPGVP